MASTTTVKEFDFFDSGSPYLRHPLLTEERSRAEVDFLIRELSLAPGAQVLDLGCGWGRHAMVLAEQEMAVTAVDPSPAMLSVAATQTAAAGLTVTYIEAKAERYRPLHGFDAVLALFGTLGQIHAGEENSALVQTAYAALEPTGGRFVVEVAQRESVVADLRMEERFVDEMTTTTVQRRFDRKRQVLQEIFFVETAKEQTRYILRRRLFSRDELESLLEYAGFAIEERWSGYDGAPLTPASPTMLLVARAC